ncbi:MAG: MgtC/SapB family protein [Nitrospirae bacterium]|nr:MgtC/SapB family protein [Nitrospirota bacterium]
MFRLVLAALIGGIIGFEREVHGRAAGFRTQLIVCVAAVLIMIVSENYYYHLKYLDPTLRIDPARISAGALIGIGFLGAGVIVKSGFAIRGLTTAASLWMVSAIGLAIGAGLYLEGIASAAITIIALVFLRWLERHMKILRFKTITISTDMIGNAEGAVRSILSDFKVHIHSVDYHQDKIKGELTYNFSVSSRNKDAIKDIFFKIGALEFIKTVRIAG